MFFPQLWALHQPTTPPKIPPPPLLWPGPAVRLWSWTHRSNTNKVSRGQTRPVSSVHSTAFNKSRLKDTKREIRDQQEQEQEAEPYLMLCTRPPSLKCLSLLSILHQSETSRKENKHWSLKRELTNKDRDGRVGDESLSTLNMLKITVVLQMYVIQLN